ncbi:hypothetical protein Cadr_000003140 [Camelus dromedarius]|uniref:Uncharacterized protein n=1 Tax=Camelus dromedarius TaxID=9838 RepID=A0A5N4C432_CAMDR|nr:hypothetical protein Cadr_000003140 [Camelus dromedarius]
MWQRICLAFSYSPPPPFPFLFPPSPPFHHFPSEELPPGRGRTGLPLRLSRPPPLYSDREPPSNSGTSGAAFGPRRHGTNSLTNPPAAAVHQAPAPAPASSSPAPIFSLLILPARMLRTPPPPSAGENEPVTSPWMTPRHPSEAYSTAGEEEEEEEEEKVATWNWVAGSSKGYHEVSRAFGKPEIAFPVGKERQSLGKPRCGR